MLRNFKLTFCPRNLYIFYTTKSEFRRWLKPSFGCSWQSEQKRLQYLHYSVASASFEKQMYEWRRKRRFSIKVNGLKYFGKFPKQKAYKQYLSFFLVLEKFKKLSMQFAFISFLKGRWWFCHFGNPIMRLILCLIRNQHCHNHCFQLRSKCILWAGHIQTPLKNITPLLQYSPEGTEACDKRHGN